MKFDFNKIISYQNKDKAEVGKRYYFFNSIEEDILTNLKTYSTLSRLISFDDDFYNEKRPFYSMNEDSYSFIYPVEDSRYMTYEEIYNLWQKDKLALYKVKVDSQGNFIKGFISAFEYNSDNKAIGFYIGDYLVSLGKKGEDDFVIHLSDVEDNEGNPLMIEED